MSSTRKLLSFRAAPLALVLLASFVAPRASDPAQMRAASLRRLNLNGTPAALPAALASLADGVAADPTKVNTATTSSSVSGLGGQTGRIAVPLGDVNGDRVADVLDVRASGKSLGYQVISGSQGMTLWRKAAIVRPADVLASVFPAQINGGATDFYLLEQFEKDSAVTWTVHAVDGATGADLWANTGSIPTGLPPQQIPPTIPPVTVPTGPPTIPPTGLPSIDPSALPTGVPSVDPSSIPSSIPSGLPSIDPSALPTPTGLPSVDPSALPSGLPSVDPSALPTPTDLPTAAPSPSGVPSVDPSALPSVDPSSLPSILPTGSPGAAPARRSARSGSSVGPIPIAGYATGATPVDVDADGFDDFPLTQHLALVTPDSATTVVSTLSTLKATSGTTIATITAVGRDAIPAVLVTGDLMGASSSGLLAVDEISAGANSVVTYRAFTRSGTPLWIAAEQGRPGTLGAYDATSDLNGDGSADVLTSRLPIVSGLSATTVTARTSPIGQLAWTRTLEETATAIVAGQLDAAPGADVITQGLVVESGRIPKNVVYRGLSGQTGADMYSRNARVANGGASGDWFATLTIDAGRLDTDATPDMVHAVGAVPSDLSPTTWSQAAISAKAGAVLWSRTDGIAPGTPAGGNLVDNSAHDIVGVQESTTRTSDSLVVKAASGADGIARWQSRVTIGGGTERVRSLRAQASDPTQAGNLILTIVQRSGTGTRSLIVSLRGATGQVMWIRTN